MRHACEFIRLKDQAGLELPNCEIRENPLFGFRMPKQSPAAFIARWSKSTRKETAAYQDHFRDLCALVGYTPTGEEEAGLFQQHVKKNTGEAGFSDVWLKGKFAIEYKSPGADLDKAYLQLLEYREDLGNPPILGVCDTRRLRLITNFTGSKPRKIEIGPEEFGTEEALRVLGLLFNDPQGLDPSKQVARVTLEAAREVGALATRLEAQGHSQMEVAHFLMKVIFVFFAAHATLLPKGVVTQLFEGAIKKPDLAKDFLERLFKAMRKGDGGSAFLGEEIWWFNGGLFEDARALPLNLDDLKILQRVAALDWTGVDPVIFGNLYEYGLGTVDRARRGVHYTSREDILTLLEPTLFRPLRRRWETLRAATDSALAKGAKGKAKKALEAALEAFREDLGKVQVLDPACGSGNFLLVALQGLLNLEEEVVHYLAQHFHQGQTALAWSFRTGPLQLHGIEVLEFPKELASVVVWIGHLQWLISRGYFHREEPILTNLDPIKLGDALALPWPEVDVIVGNPPFIGSKKLRENLGDQAVDALFANWRGKVPREADYVCYWFERARKHILAGKARRAGLLSTNSIRQGKNREVMDLISESLEIFYAESDRPWNLKGAAVRVSMVGFGHRDEGEPTILDGSVVDRIYPNLSSTFDPSRAKRLRDNRGLSFMGDTKGGPFDVPGQLAKDWLTLPLNPNGRPNSDVLKPWANGQEITGRPQGKWILDFGMGPLASGQEPIPGVLHLADSELSYYSAPYAYAKQHVLPAWAASRTGHRREWFVHAEPRPAMRSALNGLTRFLVTPCVSKHRIFAWLKGDVLPDHALIVFANSEDSWFGILQSRIHDMWALAMCSFLGVGNDARYTPNSTFETFPLPQGFRTSPPHPIAQAGKALHEAREAWLNPPGASQEHLNSRTLTTLYNSRERGQETWLNNLHRDLDVAVLQAYGWGDLAAPLFSEEERLRASNQEGEALGLALSQTAPGLELLHRLLALNNSRP